MLFNCAPQRINAFWLDKYKGDKKLKGIKTPTKMVFFVSITRT